MLTNPVMKRVPSQLRRVIAPGRKWPMKREPRTMSTPGSKAASMSRDLRRIVLAVGVDEEQDLAAGVVDATLQREALAAGCCSSRMHVGAGGARQLP